ncbi:MAG: hypothetical protein CL946_02285 [Ectothiorhodospiraceae bacterium]|nr:hypothetical protein [Ectothiorhodospiraceae bacterium]
MRIVMVCPDLKRVCGRTRMAMTLIHGLIESGEDITLVTNAESDEGLYSGIAALETRIAPVGPNDKNVASMPKALQALRDAVKDADIVHTHHRYPAMLIELLRPYRSFRHITTVHSYLRGKRFFRFGSASVVAVSDSVKNFLMDRFSVPPAQIKVIPNGIERSAATERATNTGTDFTVVAVGRFSREKGFDILLEAWNIFLKEVTAPCRLLIAGSGEEESLLRSMADESVEFLGEVADMNSVYAQADAVVIPSREETVSYVLLESGDAGVPVVCSDVGGMADIVEDGTTARVFPSENSGALASMLQDVHSDKDSQDRIARALQRVVHESYTNDAMISTYREHYRNEFELLIES